MKGIQFRTPFVNYVTATRLKTHLRVDDKEGFTLLVQVDTFPNCPQHLKGVSIKIQIDSGARFSVPTKLMAVAERPRRSAIGDAIKPNA